MPTFKKTEIVDARQFTGGAQNGSGLLLWIQSNQGRAVYMKPNDERYERLMVQVQTYEHQPAYVGDWIVHNQNGSFSVVRPLTFEFDYKQV